MAQRPFAGRHTELKLEKLAAYLDAYTTALKKQNFTLIYFDAFAGTGDIPRSSREVPMFEGDDYRAFVVGSAERALSIRNPFDEYIFVEKSGKNVVQLNRLKTRYPALSARISIVKGDANAEVCNFCQNRDWRKCRAVVFLDPFGNQVEWRSITAIAGTSAIDLWYLFPAGLGVHRQIGRDGMVHYTHEASLDNLFGTNQWREQFVETESRRDLFENVQDFTVKTATPQSITKFMIKRMKTIFRGGVLDQCLPLGSGGVHMYSLLFAWANPSEKAKLAGKLAMAVIRSRSRGRTK